jgi:YbgC/YbaW family acyl-CoA thioester hydrolase
MGAPVFDREPRSTTIVAFKDCDPFGMLYNVRYLDYIMDARFEQLLRFYDFDFYRELQRTKEAQVIQGHRITYLESARAHERITLRTRVLGFTNNLVHLEGMMFNEDMTRLKALLWTRLLYVALPQGTPINHPESFSAFLSAIQAQDDVPSSLDYDTRLGELRTRYQRAKGP